MGAPDDVPLGGVGASNDDDRPGAGAGSGNVGDGASGGEGASGGLGSAGEGGTAGGGPLVSVCGVSTPVEGGYELCESGVFHRAQVTECAVTPPRTEPLPDHGSDQCRRDADCADGPHGYCLTDFSFGNGVCRYGCANDSECRRGSICVCGELRGLAGLCLPSTCVSDADCGGGDLLCRSYGCFWKEGFACQTSQDECATNSDCGPSTISRSSGCYPKEGQLSCDIDACYLVGPPSDR